MTLEECMKKLDDNAIEKENAIFCAVCGIVDKNKHKKYNKKELEIKKIL